MSVKQRLKEYLKFKKITERAFAESINVSSGYVGAISKSIQPDKMQSISMQYPDLNPIWLLMGDGEMLLSDKSNADKSENVKPENLPSGILEELRENYLVKENRLLAIIESQQRTIEILAKEKTADTAVGA